MSKLQQALSVLIEVGEYLEQQADVRDGSDGVPLPNEAMSLQMQVDALIPWFQCRDCKLAKEPERLSDGRCLLCERAHREKLVEAGQ